MLRAENLTVSVEGKEVVKNVSLNVPPGQIHLLLGKNGSGKSSFCMAMAGHPDYEIESGDVFIQEKKMTDEMPEEKAKEGLFTSFQNPPSIEGLSVIQLVKTSINALKEKQGKKPLSAGDFFHNLQKLQAEIGIDQSLLTRSLNVGFSGGEKKKIEMLQMRFAQPNVALLDEPDSGVDVNTKRVISKTVNALRDQEHTSFLVVTHTFDFAKELNADKIYVMKEGQIVEEGGPELLDKIEKEGF